MITKSIHSAFLCGENEMHIAKVIHLYNRIVLYFEFECTKVIIPFKKSRRRIVLYSPVNENFEKYLSPPNAENFLFITEIVYRFVFYDGFPSHYSFFANLSITASEMKKLNRISKHIKTYAEIPTCWE